MSKANSFVTRHSAYYYLVQFLLLVNLLVVPFTQLKYGKNMGSFCSPYYFFANFMERAANSSNGIQMYKHEPLAFAIFFIIIVALLLMLVAFVLKIALKKDFTILFGAQSAILLVVSVLMIVFHVVNFDLVMSGKFFMSFGVAEAIILMFVSIGALVAKLIK